MKYKNIREEELKNKVGTDWFKSFDATEILGNIDFTVYPKQDNIFGRTPLLWAEAKTGNYDVATMFVQLILTIGKARTFDKTLPPAFLGAFDFKKIAFVPYISVQDIFYLNDFNWNVTPSNHETKEFKLIKNRVEAAIETNTSVYDYEKDEKELKHFIANNIAKSTETAKIRIDKNNFIPIYLRWLDIVKPTIDVHWDQLKKATILDSDFYLADLFVDDKDTQMIDDDITLRDNLFVVFENQGYKISKENIKQMFDATIRIRNKDAYQAFWKRYKRPPIKEFQEYIIERRDLLVPQDIRERQGAFFTPRIWVELSQKYLADYLGENWQDDYYIWDCAAGTGNLLAGLTNKYNIFASTLDQADVKVIHERIEHGANLLKNHVFQFDFLNDDFTKLPQNLQDIINDENKRKKLVIYINPPYAEAGGTVKGTAKSNVSNETLIHKNIGSFVDDFSKRELFIQFFIRIYNELPDVKLCEFSKLKIIQAPYFKNFRNTFLAELKSMFIVPANSFDNVKGKFPIGFFIWDTSIKVRFTSKEADIYGADGDFCGTKLFINYDNRKNINDWLRPTWKDLKSRLTFLTCNSNDFQHQNEVVLQISKSNETSTFYKPVTVNNIIQSLIYFSVRLCINSTWLNDRDQFLYPNDGWKNDLQFQNDCLAFALFHSQNRITSKEGTNHWIPFTENEVNAKEKFASNFMTDYIKGRAPQPPKGEQQTALFASSAPSPSERAGVRLLFSTEATEVFDAGRELWKYYNSFDAIIPNASLYDIREFFQGRNDKGRMNPRSTDAHYTELIAALRNKLNILADKIKPKIYEYEFLIA